MRITRRRSKFRRDFRREVSGRYSYLLRSNGDLERIIALLENDLPLPFVCRDHPLHGEWEGCRECHIRPNFLMVYKYEGEDLLVLKRLGFHSEIFGM